VGLPDRISARANARLGRTRSSSPLSFDEWASYFSWNGTQYPVVNLSYSGGNREQSPADAGSAYVGNSVIFSLTQARFQLFSQVGFQWTRFKGAQPTDLFGSPELSILERPSPGRTTVDMLARMEVDVTAAGNAYIARTAPDRLGRLKPNYVTIILGSQSDADNPQDAADVEVAGYAYLPPTGRARFYPAGTVAHYAPIPNPYASYLGLSWVTSALIEIVGDDLANQHKVKFFENGATPNMVIKFDPSVGLDSVKKFRDLMDDEHAGVMNAYKTLYLGGGADATVVGKDFAQLEFAITQGKGESRLASAAGVSPSWVGFSEGLAGSALNAGNFTAARRRISDGTLEHLWRCAAGCLENVVDRPARADSSVRLWYDNRIPFMRIDEGDRAAVQTQEAATIGGLINNGFTAESAVAAVSNNDWSLLEHTGLISVQLQPPGKGSESPTGVPEDAPSPASLPPGPAPSANGSAPANAGAN
jgi:Phage portal protein